MIGPEAQLLIERLAGVDPARPRHDPAAAEAALLRHLAAMGAEPRPLLWLTCPEEALRRAAAHPKGHRRRWRQGIRRAVPWYLRPLVHLGESPPNTPHTEYFHLQGAAEGARDRCLRAAALVGPAERARLAAALDAAESDEVWDAALAAARVPFWVGVLAAAGLGGSGAVPVARQAAEAVVEHNVRTVLHHPDQGRYADLWRPMVEAYEAGLCAVWIGPDEVLGLAWHGRPAPQAQPADGLAHPIHQPGAAGDPADAGSERARSLERNWSESGT